MESRLRASRPEASRDLVDAIAARTTARPRRRAALVFAVVLSSILVASLAAFGGVSYAAQAVTSTVSSATSTLTSSYSGTHTTTTTTTTPSGNQYGNGFHGCTPGYWKQTQHFFAWGGISQSQSFNTTFGVTQNKVGSKYGSGYATSFSLLDALNDGGGGISALARQGTAAYLNSLRPGMNFPYSTSQVIAMVQSAIQSGNATTIENTKNALEAANSLEGPLC